MANVTVTIDESTCFGSGDCARLAPSAFVVEGGVAKVLDASSVDVETLHKAAGSCPSGAIEVAVAG